MRWQRIHQSLNIPSTTTEEQKKNTSLDSGHDATTILLQSLFLANHKVRKTVSMVVASLMPMLMLYLLLSPMLLLRVI